MVEGRRKKEEGRRKKEEGRRKKEEGRRKKALRHFDYAQRSVLSARCPMGGTSCQLELGYIFELMLCKNNTVKMTKLLTVWEIKTAPNTVVTWKVFWGGRLVRLGGPMN